MNIQKEMIVNWFGHELTRDEAAACKLAHRWTENWDLPVPEGIEEAYERETGKSCVYWRSESDPNRCGDPSDETLPRSEDFETNGYTEGFYGWYEAKVVECVRSGTTDPEEIWKRIAGGK